MKYLVVSALWFLDASRLDWAFSNWIIHCLVCDFMRGPAEKRWVKFFSRGRLHPVIWISTGNLSTSYLASGLHGHSISRKLGEQDVRQCLVRPHHHQQPWNCGSGKTWTSAVAQMPSKFHRKPGFIEKAMSIGKMSGSNSQWSTEGLKDGSWV